MAIFPPGQVTPLGDQITTLGTVPEIAFVAPSGNKWHIGGGQAPDAGIHSGMVLKQISGLQPPFDLLDIQGARQDGTTNLDTVFDPCVIDLTLEASAFTVDEFRRVVRAWISDWTPPNVLTMSWFTRELGEWWMPVRQYKTFPDQLLAIPAMHRRQVFTWTCRGDNAFWYGVDSVSSFALASGQSSGSGFNPVTNLGPLPTWLRHLVYGPGTFSIGDGTSGTSISFGPLLDGQIALISTLPRIRSVVDLSPDQAPQSLTKLQTLVEALLDYAISVQKPPLLQYFESLFGILPPNGPLYSLLGGRFQTPIPGKPDGAMPTTSYIPVSISGGNSNSKIVTAITPYRTYPE
ncbi:hypothetical protein E2F47_23500 [Mycobacterium eburneum]|nr:hypothetical protein [Mycobacterium eburneum]TDH48485.1 hypothetical protein E2F47_23500 [Mycobacterium eburneum]